MVLEIIDLGSQVEIQSTEGNQSHDKDTVTFRVSEHNNDSVFIMINGVSISGTDDIALEDLTIEGNTPANMVEFRTMWMAVFPNPGGSGTPTLADVLAAGNSAGDLRITDLDDPAGGQDAATKAFVENSFEGNLGYISYHAILSQSGTSNPVANVQKNTLPGGAIAWTRTGVGEYQGVLTGAFIENKTMIFPSSHSLYLGTVIISWVDVNTITISTSDNGNPADSIIGANGFLKFIEIRVYN